MSDFKIILTLIAEREFFDACDWYEKQQKGLSENFISHLKSSYKLIQNRPKHYPKKSRNYREFIMKTFPFIILFELYEANNEIIIHSIFHTSRNPINK